MGKKVDPLTTPSAYQDQIKFIIKLQALYRGHSVRLKLKKLKEMVQVTEDSLNFRTKIRVLITKM